MKGIGSLGQGVWGPILNSVLCLVGKACPQQGSNFGLFTAKAASNLSGMLRGHALHLCPRGLCGGLRKHQPRAAWGGKVGGNTDTPGARFPLAVTVNQCVRGSTAASKDYKTRGSLHDCHQSSIDGAGIELCLPAARQPGDLAKAIELAGLQRSCL